MGKIILGILIGIFLLVVVSAVVYDSKQSAINEIQNRKNTVQNINQITYITPKVCNVEYETELVSGCEVCFNISFSEGIIDTCLFIEETDTKKQMDDKVMEYAQFRIDTLYSSQPYTYEEFDIVGDTISP